MELVRPKGAGIYMGLPAFLWHCWQLHHGPLLPACPRGEASPPLP